MAASTWDFNAGEDNSLTKLVPQPSATMGSVTLPSDGNVLNVEVGAPDAKAVQMVPPGADWAGRRTTGLLPVTIIWRWDLHAASDANLNAIEAYIMAYVKDGRGYTIRDGTSGSNRSGTAVLDRARRIGPRRVLAGGKSRQVWELTFRVLRPTISATGF